MLRGRARHVFTRRWCVKSLSWQSVAFCAKAELACETLFASILRRMWAGVGVAPGAKAKFAYEVVFASILRRMWVDVGVALWCQSEICVWSRICQHIAANVVNVGAAFCTIAEFACGTPFASMWRRLIVIRPGGFLPVAIAIAPVGHCQMRGGAALAAVPSAFSVYCMELGNTCLVGNGDPCLRLFVCVARRRVSSDIQVPLPCSIAHFGVVASAFPDVGP